jgi:hypothetical protein
LDSGDRYRGIRGTPIPPSRPVASNPPAVQRLEISITPWTSPGRPLAGGRRSAFGPRLCRRRLRSRRRPGRWKRRGGQRRTPSGQRRRRGGRSWPGCEGGPGAGKGLAAEGRGGAEGGHGAHVPGAGRGEGVRGRGGPDGLPYDGSRSWWSTLLDTSQPPAASLSTVVILRGPQRASRGLIVRMSGERAPTPPRVFLLRLHFIPYYRS